MTRKNQTFAATVPVRLSSCLLVPLGDDESRSISRELANMDPWLTLGYRPDSLLKYLTQTDPALSRFAIVARGETAGVLCLRYPWLLGPYIELFAVYAPWSGKGLGGQILAWLEESFAAHSKNIWATVSAFNTSARAFYRRSGFEEVAPLKDLVRAGYDEILLRKDLATKQREPHGDSRC